MTRRPHVLRAALAASGLLVAGLVSGAPARADGTAPPWVPSGVDQDQNAIAGLTFYDAAGNVITGGSTSTAPFAAYVEGRKTTRVVAWTDTKAALFAYVPQEGQAPDTWGTSTQLGLASDFPDASAPGALATTTLPVYSAHNDDSTLDSVITDFPNASSTAGYAHVYELRLYTNAAHHTLSGEYDYADISVDPVAHTWSVVWTPSAAAAPGAPTGAHATAGNAAATVSWTAPANNGGAAVTGYDVEYSANGGTTWTHASSAFHTSTATSHAVGGLTNGTAYVFRVAAINAAGTGAYSAASAAVTPVADASGLAISAPASVRYGSTATVRATLKDTKTNTALGGQRVTLYQRTSSSRPWAVAKAVTTSSSGAASAALKPTAGEQFQWRYAGSATHKAVTSTTVSTAVVQVVSAKANHSSIKHGGTVQVYGTVAPAGSGQRVYLQQLVKSSWKTLKTSATIKRQKLPNGKTATGFVLTIKLGSKGTVKLRVYKPTTSSLAAGYSGTVSVKVT